MNEHAHWRISKVFYLTCLFVIIWVGIELGLHFLLTEQQKSLFSDINAPFLDLCACAAIIWAVKTSSFLSKRFALGWGVIGLAYLLFTFGDVIWAFFELILKQEPFPSIADFFYLEYYPLFFVGIHLK
jgi:hypothetical protein